MLGTWPNRRSCDISIRRSGSTSVATLLLRKITRFHEKKTLDSQKDTRIQIRDRFVRLQENWFCKMARKMRYNANKDIAQTELIVNQRQRKREIAATFVFFVLVTETYNR